MCLCEYVLHSEYKNLIIFELFQLKNLNITTNNNNIYYFKLLNIFLKGTSFPKWWDRKGGTSDKGERAASPRVRIISDPSPHVQLMSHDCNH